MPNPLKKIFTVPNIISFVRILLIPVFAWAYLRGHMLLALALVAVSGVSDKLDGTIARHTNQVSDLGKMLDPVADKLTQMTLAVLMFIRFYASQDAWMRAFAWVFLGFIGKEVLMLLFALLMLLLGKRPGAAEIWGKAATVAFYIVMLLLLLAGPEVGVLAAYLPWAVLPRWAVQVLVILNLAFTFVAFFGYIPDTYRKLFKEGKVEEKE